jgi:DNA helicase IV
MADAMSQGASGTHQNRSERDSFVSLYADRIAALDAVENRLLFGRTDTDDGATWIGRIGLTDDDQRVLQIDWRAPAAAAFYQATAASPMGLVRRRHISTEARRIVGISDEVFDGDSEVAGSSSVEGSSDSALLAALRAARTGRMGDIVATIQAEQDRIIRSDAKGALVVQGGPGTGKTAVALHRAAYLLYTHRDRYERSGVLVVGPTPVFLRYVEEVLPSLGETGVVLTSIPELVPGVQVGGHDDPAVAEVKGRRVMAEVLARAVKARQRVPANGVSVVVGGTRLHLAPSVIRRAGHDALRDHENHNAARPVVLLALLNQLATRMARRNKLDPGDAAVREDLIAELREEPAVRRELNLLWMPLTPQRVLSELLSRPADLAAAADGVLSRADQELLLRDATSGFTVDDVPLLDELADLLGDDLAAARADAARREAEDRRAAAYASHVLEATTDASDSESIEGYYSALVSGEQLAARFAEQGPARTLAERAGADREWAYAHVVVDEAQELSAMAWRAIARRCPSRSMTVVGDLAQTASAAGAASWRGALDEVTRGVWRVEELTINYRTPARIAAVADRVLAAMDRGLTAPRAVRDGEHDPVAHAVDDALVGTVEVVRSLLGEPGRTVVVALPAVVQPLTSALREAGVDASAGLRGLDSPVAVMAPDDVKGLEFDTVVVVEPSDLLDRSTGLADLYVALTRATSRLELVHARELPEVLRPL